MPKITWEEKKKERNAVGLHTDDCEVLKQAQVSVRWFFKMFRLLLHLSFRFQLRLNSAEFAGGGGSCNK